MQKIQEMHAINLPPRAMVLSLLGTGLRNELFLVRVPVWTKHGMCLFAFPYYQNTFNLGVLKQGIKYSKVHKGPYAELSTHPGVNPAFAHMCTLPVTPKGINWSRRRRW